MNEETKEKIEKLARNLKEMHLAATIEEARKRAKEIILSTAKEGDKSIKEMMEEALQKEEETTKDAETTENECESKEEE